MNNVTSTWLCTSFGYTLNSLFGKEQVKTLGICSACDMVLFLFCGGSRFNFCYTLSTILKSIVMPVFTIYSV